MINIPSSQTPLVLLTGFLGAGKTTFLQNLVTAALEKDFVPHVILNDYENADVGGIGGTLAGNALSLAAMRATLSSVLTEEAYARLIGPCEVAFLMAE